MVNILDRATTKQMISFAVFLNEVELMAKAEGLFEGKSSTARTLMYDALEEFYECGLDVNRTMMMLSNLANDDSMKLHELVEKYKS